MMVTGSPFFLLRSIWDPSLYISGAHNKLLSLHQSVTLCYNPKYLAGRVLNVLDTFSSSPLKPFLLSSQPCISLADHYHGRAAPSPVPMAGPWPLPAPLLPALLLNTPCAPISKVSAVTRGLHPPTLHRCAGCQQHLLWHRVTLSGTCTQKHDRFSL